MSAASMPLTKQLTVAIIDSNPALGREEHFKKDDPPDSRVSTVTPATISFYKGIRLLSSCSLCSSTFKSRLSFFFFSGFHF